MGSFASQKRNSVWCCSQNKGQLDNDCNVLGEAHFGLSPTETKDVNRQVLGPMQEPRE